MNTNENQLVSIGKTLKTLTQKYHAGYPSKYSKMMLEGINIFLDALEGVKNERTPVQPEPEIEQTVSESIPAEIEIQNWQEEPGTPTTSELPTETKPAKKTKYPINKKK